MNATVKLARLLRPQSGHDDREDLIGVVLSFTQPTTSVPCTASVDFEGQGTGTTCLSTDHYTDATPAPAAGDIVIARSYGQDTVIIGRIS